MISIIIIVKNDRKIKILLDNLVNISLSEKVEIIVVDASKGNLDDIKQSQPNVKWLYYFDKDNKRFTYSDQRNLGIKNAKGDVIVFIDSDCIPTKNWLNELVKPIRGKGENIVAGYVKSIGKESINSIIWDKIQNKKYITECPSLNMSFKKEILKKIGYFSEYFNGGGEDIDFTWRAVKAGYSIYYNKNAILYHDWGNFKEEVKRTLRGGRTSVRLYKKHPEKWKNLISNNADVIIYPLYILFSPIILIWPYYLSILIVPFIRNLTSKSLRRNSVKKIYLDLVRGGGVLLELAYSKI
jgi:GT2 family glycosyltransferase